MAFKSRFFHRKFFGYTFYQKRFIFSCPCHNMLKADHSLCKKYYTAEKYQGMDAIISVAMSSINKLLNKKCYEYLSFCDNENIIKSNQFLSNILLSLFIHYGSQYHEYYEFFSNIQVYKELIYIFKPSINRQLTSDYLVVNNVSSSGIDRSNINFKYNSILLNEKYKSSNFYYLNLLSTKFVFEPSTFLTQLEQNIFGKEHVNKITWGKHNYNYLKTAYSAFFVLYFIVLLSIKICL